MHLPVTEFVASLAWFAKAALVSPAWKSAAASNVVIGFSRTNVQSGQDERANQTKSASANQLDDAGKCIFRGPFRLRIGAGSAGSKGFVRAADAFAGHGARRVARMVRQSGLGQARALRRQVCAASGVSRPGAQAGSDDRESDQACFKQFSLDVTNPHMVRSAGSRGAARCVLRGKRHAVAFPCALSADRKRGAMTSGDGSRRRTRTIASDATYAVTGKRIVSLGTARPGASLSHCVRGRGAARCVFPHRRAGSREPPGSTTARRCHGAVRSAKCEAEPLPRLRAGSEAVLVRFARSSGPACA